jgi:hypothetical protein
MRSRTVFLVTIISAACGHVAAPGLPETKSDAFTYWLLTNAGERGEPTACAASPINVGPTWMARPRDRQVQLPLPTTFFPERWNLPQDRMFFPAVGWQYGQEWAPGIQVIAAWDRWTRVQLHGEPGDALFQVINRRGYQPFVAAAPWKLTASPECILALPNQPIRVLFFELHHPTYPSRWGMVAFWRGRPGDGFLSALVLGPDPAIQAEALQILRGQVP